MDNISGDTVIGKYSGSDRTRGIHQACRGLFPPPLPFTDGSNNFLKISSGSGDVDVYVGDGGSADVQTHGGKSSA